MATSDDPNARPRVYSSAADLPGVPPHPKFRHVAYCDSRGVFLGITGDGRQRWSKDTDPLPSKLRKAPTFDNLEDLYDFLGDAHRDKLPEGVELRQVATTAKEATVDEVGTAGYGRWGDWDGVSKR